MRIKPENMCWLREPEEYYFENEELLVKSKPFTDLWQKTYYHFINDNAPMLLTQSDEPYFTFQVRTHFKGKRRFDQCGIILWIDSENWLKASAEFQSENSMQLGSVVTQFGYSDWASYDINGDIDTIWYRLSRREKDWQVQVSFDGKNWQQIRVCHMSKTSEEVKFGVYIASPENSTFKASFSHMELLDCKWKAHDGQQPGQNLLE